jgi:hypothetical protein
MQGPNTRVAWEHRACAAGTTHHPLTLAESNSRRLETVRRKPSQYDDGIPNLLPSLTHRRFHMNHSILRESILDQVAVTAALVITALLTMNQIVLLM